MSQFANDHQEQRFAEPLGQSGQSRLHLIGETVFQRVADRDAYVERRTVSNRFWGWALSPMVDNPSTQNGRQPSAVSPSRLITSTALPRRTKRLLHQILSFVRIANHTVSNSVQDGSMFVD